MDDVLVLSVPCSSRETVLIRFKDKKPTNSSSLNKRKKNHRKSKAWSSDLSVCVYQTVAFSSVMMMMSSSHLHLSDE